MPLVGVIRFINPAEVEKAVTTRSRLTPTKSASGAMMGMDRVARPEVEGTRKAMGR